MGLILDVEPYAVSEARNHAFRRKVTRTAIDAIVGTDPYALYGFQTDEPTLVGSYNESGFGFLANMAWDNAALRSGIGWYVDPIIGAWGSGMVGDGGASGHYGSVVACSANTLDGGEAFSILVTFLADGAGEGGTGHLIYKENGYRLYFSAANTLRFEVWDGAAWRGSDTGATVTYGEWRQLCVVYDGTQAAADRIKLYLDGRDVTVAGANIPASLTDDGNNLYILDDAANASAWDGLLGTLATVPAWAFTEAQAQSFCEIRGLFQPTVADQAAINAPGGHGVPDCDFTRAEDDHFYAFQAQPIKTSAGTVLLWFTPRDMTNEQTLFGVTEFADATGHRYLIKLRGDIALDPIEFMAWGSGVVCDLRLQIPFGALNMNVPSFVVFTSDGSTVQGFLNGEEQVVSPVVGANSGQWFGDYDDADTVCWAAGRENAIVNELEGDSPSVKVYDRALAPIEIAQIWQKNAGGPGLRGYPER